MTVRTAIFAFVLMLGTGCASEKHDGATGFITSNWSAPASAENDNGVARDSYGRPYHYAHLGKEIPAFEAPLHGGGTFNTNDIDTWTVIDVWGIWCGDCRRDSPYAAKLARELARNKKIDYIALHTPASKTRIHEAFGSYGSIQNYFETEGYSYPTAIDSDATIREKLSIVWTPTYLLVDPNGIVKGFRSELAVSGKRPVKRFIRDIRKVMRRDGKHRANIMRANQRLLLPKGAGGIL